MRSRKGRKNLRTGAVNAALFLACSVFFLASIAPASTAHAQASNLGWVWQNPRPQGNPLLSIHFAKDKLHGLAVGSDNTILRTEDGGFTWRRQAGPEGITYSDVFVIDRSNAVAVG